MNSTDIDVSGYSDKAIGMLGQISLWLKETASKIGIDYSINLLMITVSVIVILLASKVTNKLAKFAIWIIALILLASGVYQLLGGGA